jgi:hypothetical protein
MRASTRLGLLAAVLACAVAVRTPTARADYEETEARLKAAGIEEGLRARIHAAIDRGVTWLLSRQAGDGSFHAVARKASASPTVTVTTEYGPGASVLCALAPRHADTEEARKGLERVRDHLLQDHDVRKQLVRGTYEAGITAMLVMGEKEEAVLAREIARRLSSKQASSGYWGYGNGISLRQGPANLSTTQFAALGLWSTLHTGAEIPPRIWRRLAEAHCRLQGPDGGWGYVSGKPSLGTWCPQGTFMGLADLLLAEESLARTPNEHDDLEKKIEAAASPSP